METTSKYCKLLLYTGYKLIYTSSFRYYPIASDITQFQFQSNWIKLINLIKIEEVEEVEKVFIE